MILDVQVVRVFTDDAGQWGNPLGIVDARRVTPDRYQEVARELNFSETVFLDFPDGPRESVSVRIFTPARELRFAGHPSVGTAVWLATRGTPVQALHVPAGAVTVRVEESSARIRARAEWAPEFDFRELASEGEVLAQNPADHVDGHLYFWAWTDEQQGQLRSRMFAPDLGVAEDEATGAAAVRITELLGRDLRIHQGHGSLLSTSLLGDGWVELAGRVVADAPRTLEI